MVPFVCVKSVRKKSIRSFPVKYEHLHWQASAKIFLCSCLHSETCFCGLLSHSKIGTILKKFLKTKAFIICSKIQFYCAYPSFHPRGQSPLISLQNSITDKRKAFNLRNAPRSTCARVRFAKRRVGSCLRRRGRQAGGQVLNLSASAPWLTWSEQQTQRVSEQSERNEENISAVGSPKLVRVFVQTALFLCSVWRI